MSDIRIRLLQTLDEMAMAVELQKVYWGDDAHDLVPQHMLMSMAQAGGHVHGAFDNERLVGILLGFLGADIDPDDDQSAPHRLYVMSKRMIVLPGNRGRKIGERLKWAQREFAFRHHINLVQWTFDPVLARNAYLNLRKLGAVIQTYKRDYFGTNADHPTLHGDRVVANWWVGHEHVARQFANERATVPSVAYANQTMIDTDGLLKPIGYERPDYEAIALEIPKEFVPLERLNPQLGQQWRDHIRHAFMDLLSAGYIAIDMARASEVPAIDSSFADERERIFYVFVRDDGSFGF